MMDEHKQSDPSLPHRTTSRPRKTVLPQRRSTRPKKPPEHFSSTICLTEMERGDREKTEEDNPSSDKIKLIRKMGNWIMNNDHEENKSKRFKSKKNGENKTIKYKSSGHAGAHSERNILNNNIEDEIVNILCEEVPFSTLVPPVPAEETGRVEFRHPSPENFVTLDHNYAIPLTKGVRVKQHQNPQNATKELELQDEDEVQIICEIAAKVLKINETEIKEEIEDLAETDIPSVTNKELSTTKSMNNNGNVAQNIVKEESEPENKDEVQTIGETDKNSTVQNVINTETIREFEYSNEKVQSEGSLGEDETDDVVNGTANVAIGHMVRGVGPRVEESSKEEENRQQGADQVEADRRQGVDEDRRHGMDEDRRHGVDEDRRQGVDEDRRQGVDEDRRHGVDEDRRQGVDESVEDRRQGVDESVEDRPLGVDGVREHGQRGMDQVRRHQGVDGVEDNQRQGVDEVEELRRQGVDQVRRHQHQGVDGVDDNRRQGVDEEEHRRQGVGEDNRRQGVDEMEDNQRQGVDEEEEHRRQGVGVVRDMRCCEACRRNDKVKIKMEIEMSAEQFVQVAKELPNIVTTAHVHAHTHD